MKTGALLSTIAHAASEPVTDAAVATVSGGNLLIAFVLRAAIALAARVLEHLGNHAAESTSSDSPAATTPQKEA